MTDPPSSISRRRSQARREGGAGYHQRRQQFLDAATEVFRTAGFQAASMNDIAIQAGSDRANLYYYFSSKHEIFTEIVQKAVAENVDFAETVARATGTVVERLRALIVNLVESYERHYPYILLYIQEDMRRMPHATKGSEGELRGLGQRYQDAVFSVVEEGRGSGELRTDIDGRMLTFAVIGAVNWLHRWYVPGGRLSATEIGEQFARILLEGAVSSPGASAKSLQGPRRHSSTPSLVRGRPGSGAAKPRRA
jgi:AcrR family transcriptional regulator